MGAVRTAVGARGPRGFCPGHATTKPQIDTTKRSSSR